MLDRRREVFNDALKCLDIITLIVGERNMSMRVGGRMLMADAYLLGGKHVAVSLCARETLHDLTSVASLLRKCTFLIMINTY